MENFEIKTGEDYSLYLYNKKLSETNYHFSDDEFMDKVRSGNLKGIKRANPGDVFTKALCYQLNSRLSEILKIKHQLLIISFKGEMNTYGIPKYVIYLPFDGLKTWSHEKFMEKFNLTMSSPIYQIKFLKL